MSSLTDYFKELVALTQLHLLQEYAQSDRLMVGQDSLLYFRDHFTQKNPSQPQKAEEKPVALASQPPSRVTTPPPPQPKQIIKTPIPPPIAPQKTTEQKIATQAKADGETTKEQKDAVFFALETPPLEAVDLTAMRKIIHEHFPKITLIDTPPQDKEAILIGRAWEQNQNTLQVAILAFEETAKHLLFLNNLTQALNVYGIEARVITARKIEQMNGWEGWLKSEQLKLAIATTSGIRSLPGLLKFYREVPNQTCHYLGQVPVLLLNDIACYLKEPSLKLSLWKAIRELL